MLRNARNLKSLVEQILDFRKLESGQMKAEMTSGDIVEFVRQILQSFELLAIEHQILFQFKNEHESIEGWFDPEKLEKILFNLLSNAFKFTASGGAITLHVRNCAEPPHDQRPGPWIELVVEDTGVGISEENLPNIFKKYFQVKSDNVSRKGSGIGLAFTRELVELMDGVIRVESRINIGTRFTVLLPITRKVFEQPDSDVQNDDLSMSEETAFFISGERTETNGKATLLVIDDHDDMVQFIRSLLNTKYSIHVAHDGESGIKTAQALMPDLIISDVMMPVKDGFSVCAELKENELTSHIPVILLTAKSSAESRIAGLESGADAYVTKPFNIPVLQIQVENLLQSREKLRRQFSKHVHIEPSEVVASPVDELFLKRAMEAVEKYMQDANFDVNFFATEMQMSKSALYRKIHSLTNLSTANFIKTMRLKRAHQLLTGGNTHITDVCYQVGFVNLSHFITSFKEQYHITPKQFCSRIEAESR